MNSNGFWIVVSNRTSGKGDHQTTRDQVVAELESRGSTIELIDADDVREARERLTHLLSAKVRIDGLIVIGGDGTVHHMVNAVFQSGCDLPIGIIPRGSGNDFARQLGLHKKPIDSLIEHFTSNQPIKIDILEVNDRIALQVISTGFDATVSSRARRMPKMLGSARYVFALFMQLGSLSATRYRLTINGDSREIEATLVAVANGKNYGGGMLISPNSENDDGVFEVLIVSPLGRLRLLLLFPRIFSGAHINHPLVSSFQATELFVEADTIAEADGEPLLRNHINHRISMRQLRTWRMA